MNTKEFIKNYVTSCNNYSGQIEDYYIIPRYVTIADGRKINILSNRELEIKRTDSSYVRRFKGDIRKYRSTLRGDWINFTRYIEEFPIVIDNRELWNDILDSYKVPKRSNIRDRYYFLLDFLFPEAGVIVEIDSDYHDNKGVYDLARDQYINRRYGLETIRMYKYGDKCNYTIFENFTKNLREKYNLKVYSNAIGRQCWIDQSKVMVDEFISDNKKSLKFIEDLLNYTDTPRYYGMNVAVTLKDIDIFSPTTISYCNPDQQLLFLNNVVDIMKCVFRMNLHIQYTSQYSTIDVRYIQDISTDNNKWDILLDNRTKISKRMTTILGPVPEEKRFQDIIDKNSISNANMMNL